MRFVTKKLFSEGKFSCKGYSLIMWTVSLTLVVAGLSFIYLPLKRALQKKIYANTDYLLWTSWEATPQQYKGETTTRSKSISLQQQVTELKQDKGGKFKTYIGPKDENKPATTEKSVSISVEKGSEDYLKIFDLNKILPSKQ